jgi:cellulose synthase/poly-beta-1,6-N-acetylglucosamine synthase-like glycosyltransferase
VGIVVSSLILALQVALMSLRPLIARFALPTLRTTDEFNTPVFSVHIATHSEPPDMVIRTLQALQNQDWPDDLYEIVVMDNNTLDEAMWRPVEAFCANNSKRLNFLHQINVHGAKAGALNIALDHTRADASHIVTVDADYVVGSDFLSAAASALERTGADYVQFPQAYSGVTGVAAGVDAELEEYFRSNAEVADEAEAVLLTGTLCVISRNALVAAGGWSGKTTTEDAEMGVRLCNAGFTGRFINQIVGQGLLPFSLADLEKQRYRWCSGNLQTLLGHFRMIFTRQGSMSLHKRLVIVSQLTAWFNLALIPALILMAALLAGRGQSVEAILAASVIVLGLSDVVLRVIGRGLRDGLGLSVTANAIACRLALAPRSAKATFDAALGEKLNFIVTNKSGSDRSSGIQIPLVQLVLFSISLAALLSASSMNPLVVVALLTFLLPLPAAIFTANSLNSYRESISLYYKDAML